MMKTYVSLFGAVVAMQGVMAQEDMGLAPLREPALPDNDPARQVPQFGNACYQNSGGQKLVSGQILQYPCNSEQRIAAYCQREEFRKNVTAQKECFFGPTSTYALDFEGCLKCKEHNGLGNAEYFRQTRQYIKELQEAFVNNDKGLTFAEVAEPLQKPYPQGDPVPSKARIENGVADINILSYWPDYPKSQQAGAPIPENKAPETTKTPETTTVSESSKASETSKAVETGTVQPAIATMPVTIYYPSKVDLQSQGKNDLAPSAKFRNTSNPSNETAFVWIAVHFDFSCNSDAANPQRAQADKQPSSDAPVETDGLTFKNSEPLYDTATTVEPASQLSVTLESTIFLINGNTCGCYDKPVIPDTNFASPAAQVGASQVQPPTFDFKFSVVGNENSDAPQLPAAGGVSPTDVKTQSRFGGQEEASPESLPWC